MRVTKHTIKHDIELLGRVIQKDDFVYLSGVTYAVYSSDCVLIGQLDYKQYNTIKGFIPCE